MRGGKAVVLVGAALFAPVAALAEVLEIAEDGTVRRHFGPARITVEASEPLSPERDQAPRPPPPSLAAAVDQAATRAGLHPNLVNAVAWAESRHNPAAVSPKGARGVMQLMPATARELGVDPDDPAQNILGGALYLRAQLDAFGGDLVKALAAYNAGPNAVRRHGGVPPYRETRDYVDRVLSRLTSPTP
jgi:soluble lytic murein transglycosylase-like protein